MKSDSSLLRILDVARWAPSGDNTQPWRFEVINDKNFLIHVTDTRDWCFFDVDGRATQLSVGALMENIAIAASAEQLQAHFKAPENIENANNFAIEVSLENALDATPHPLLPAITERATQRRAFSGQALTSEQKKSLEHSVGENYRVIWFEGKAKKQMAKVVFHWSQIPFTIPESHSLLKRVIEFGSRYSDDKIPDQAIGLDPLALLAMKWSIESWQRLNILNRYFAGTLLPRIQLNLIPGLRCGAHFVIAYNKPLVTITDHIDAGRSLQRFWLTATHLNLQLQPEMAPLILSRYTKMSINFTKDISALRLAKKLTDELAKMLYKDEDFQDKVFMGRIGEGKKPISRSIRLPLKQLLINQN